MPRTKRSMSNRGAVRRAAANRWLTSASRARSWASAQRDRFILLHIEAINSSRPRLDRKLAETRETKLSPRKVTTGSPANSASLAVAWAL